MQVAPSQTLFQAISHLGSGSRAVAAPARSVDAVQHSRQEISPAPQQAKALNRADHAGETHPDTPIRRGMFVDIRV